MSRWYLHRLRPWLISLAVCTAMLGAAMVVASSSSADSTVGNTVRDGAEHFIGSWRLVAFKATTADGRVIYPFGQDAQGVVTLTRDDRMSVAVWKTDRQPFAVNDQQKGTPEEYTAAMQSYITYLGTFTVDADAGTFTTHVEQSVFPNWNGTDQTRFYAFSDDYNTLSLTTVPIPFGGTTIVGALVWKRIGS
jgi:hypothetical protein